MIDEPIFFERNRVGRIYKGGKLFGDFFGDEAVDGFKPEEWIASTVKTLNKDKLSENEGVSRIKDSEIYFDELLQKYTYEMLGSGGKFRILVKILDSAVRLPAQAHPDREFSRKYFNSEYGKTESWIILGTRPNAKIYFGFNDGVDENTFSDAIEESKVNKNAMEKLMRWFEPKVGDVYIVPARTVHAIGAGCLILEVQEPTDFTIQPEYWCDDYELNEQEMYIGLSKEQAIECFEFGRLPDVRVKPKIISKSEGVKYEELIKESDTECFRVNKITLNGGCHRPDVEDSYGVYIVTSGTGEIVGDGYTKSVAQGDYFFMPYCLMGDFLIKGTLEVVECY